MKGGHICREIEKKPPWNLCTRAVLGPELHLLAAQVGVLNFRIGEQVLAGILQPDLSGF